MVKSPKAPSAVEAVAQELHLRVLKRHGFKKRSRSFAVRKGDLDRIVGFQSSSWNTPRRTSFTVNLGVGLPHFHEVWKGETAPTWAGSLLPILNLRIGRLLDEPHDHWWDVVDGEGIDQEVSELAVLLEERGLRYLFAHADSEALLQSMETLSPWELRYSKEVVRAILLDHNGRREQAVAILKKQIEDTEIDGFRAHAADILNRITSRQSA